MAINTRSSKTAKEHAFEGISHENRSKILEVANRLRIENDEDEFFWLFVAGGQFESIFIEIADRLERGNSDIQGAAASIKEYLDKARQTLEWQVSVGKQIKKLQGAELPLYEVIKQCFGYLLGIVVVVALAAGLGGYYYGKPSEADVLQLQVQAQQQLATDFFGSINSMGQWRDIRRRCISESFAAQQNCIVEYPEAN